MIFTMKEFSSYDMDVASSIPFVDLIICPEYFAAYKKEALSYFGLDKEGYKRVLRGNDFYRLNTDMSWSLTAGGTD